MKIQESTKSVVMEADEYTMIGAYRDENGTWTFHFGDRSSFYSESTPSLKISNLSDRQVHNFFKEGLWTKFDRVHIADEELHRREAEEKKNVEKKS